LYKKKTKIIVKEGGGLQSINNQFNQNISKGIEKEINKVEILKGYFQNRCQVLPFPIGG
jgi:hypothetical protein